MDYVKLSKEVSYALRHKPWEYGLEIDRDGWVNIEQLLTSLRRKEQWENLTVEHLKIMVDFSKKKRHEISQDKIRAIYGHSLPQKIVKTPEIPPITLYHGTAGYLVKDIMLQGLQPMARQYVHLSSDQETALLNGKRKDLNPIILKVDAKLAWEEGIVFYRGDNKVWLADQVPSKYIYTEDKK